MMMLLGFMFAALLVIVEICIGRVRYTSNNYRYVAVAIWFIGMLGILFYIIFDFISFLYNF